MQNDGLENGDVFMHQNKLRFGHFLLCTSSDDVNVGSFCHFVINIYENFGFGKECKHVKDLTSLLVACHGWDSPTQVHLPIFWSRPSMHMSSPYSLLPPIWYSHLISTWVCQGNMMLGMVSTKVFFMFETTFVNVEYSKTSSWVVNIGLKLKYWILKGFVCVFIIAIWWN